MQNGKIKIVFFLLAFISVQNIYAQPAKNISVTQTWTNTGVQLNAGESVTIFAQGYATWNNNGNNNQIKDWFTPAGIGGNYIDINQNYPCQNCPGMSLIGKVGTDGTPQYIGTFGTLGSQSGGTLYLGINDDIPSDNYGSWIALIFKNVTTTTSIVGSDISSSNYKLSQNYPNPFNPSTKIEYSVQTTNNIQIKIYNSLGQLVKTLVDETKIPGEYSVVWNGKDDNGSSVSSGVYFYQIQTKDFVSSKKMILLK